VLAILVICSCISALTPSEPAFHDRLRRFTTPTFRGDNLRAASRALESEIRVLIGRIQRDSLDGAAIDILKLFRLVSLDA